MLSELKDDKTQIILTCFAQIRLRGDVKHRDCAANFSFAQLAKRKS